MFDKLKVHVGELFEIVFTLRRIVSQGVRDHDHIAFWEACLNHVSLRAFRKCEYLGILVESRSQHGFDETGKCCGDVTERSSHCDRTLNEEDLFRKMSTNDN